MVFSIVCGGWVIFRAWFNLALFVDQTISTEVVPYGRPILLSDRLLEKKPEIDVEPSRTGKVDTEPISVQLPLVELGSNKLQWLTCVRSIREKE